ncbi:MAG: hypothetical protein ABH825_00620, partial [Candidatus Omnitrophota bacterium]
AEEIQDLAGYCRYCHKKVKGRFFRKAFLALIVLAIAFLLVKKEADLKLAANTVNSFFKDIREMWIITRDTIKKLPTISRDREHEMEIIERALITSGE